MIDIKVFKGYVKLVETVDEAENLFQKIKSGSIVAFDYETTGLEYDAIPLVLSICPMESMEPFVIPYDTFFSKGFSNEQIVNLCNNYFVGKRLIAHNAKYDCMIAKMSGIAESSISIHADTLGMIHLYDTSIPKGLEVRVAKDFKYGKKTFEEICGKKWEKINWSIEGDSLLEMLSGYSGEDVYWTCKLYDKYVSLLDDTSWKVLTKMEIPQINILRDAKIRGVLIDVPLLKNMESKLVPYIESVKEDIYRECGCVFNLNSPKQKKEVFFNKMHLPIIGYTETGAPSTDAGTFNEWDDMGIAVGSMLTEYSQMNKLYTGYIKAIPELVDEHNVLRGDLNAFGTETGRFSSSNPNLQNQPNSKFFPVREAFIPRPGYVFVNRDYSQLELRVLAELSRDKNLMDVFLKGGDPHSDVAHRLNITRKAAKTVNFGVIYGLSPTSLARKIGCTKEEAARIIDHDYVHAYPGVYRWKEGQNIFARKNGFVRTYFGRMRKLPKVSSGSSRDFGTAMRQSVNSPIQGTAADIVKIATMKCVKAIKESGLDCHFLLQVHDELLFEVREDQMLLADEIVRYNMEHAVTFSIPLLTDGKILRNWGEMKDDDVVTLPQRFDYSLYSTLI